MNVLGALHRNPTLAFVDEYHAEDDRHEQADQQDQLFDAHLAALTTELESAGEQRTEQLDDRSGLVVVRLQANL